MLIILPIFVQIRENILIAFGQSKRFFIHVLQFSIFLVGNKTKISYKILKKHKFPSYKFLYMTTDTVNSVIEARLLFNHYTFGAVLYLRFYQFLLNKIPNFPDFFGLLFETVLYIFETVFYYRACGI